MDLVTKILFIGLILDTLIIIAFTAMSLASSSSENPWNIGISVGFAVLVGLFLVGVVHGIRESTRRGVTKHERIADSHKQ